MKPYVLPIVAVLSLVFAVSWTLAERPVRKPSEPPGPPPEPRTAQTVAGVGLVEPGTENIALSCAVRTTVPVGFEGVATIAAAVCSPQCWSSNSDVSW